MQYLFFDIECSDGYHICSLGYVLVDKDFNVLKKEDIVINPESRFILSPHKDKPKIELAYSKEYFYKQKNFSERFEKIKRLMTKKNQIIFGHSISSDFHFLLYACKRYSLLPFTLVGYDTQKMYKEATGKQHVESLEKIINEIGVKQKIKYHKSSEDAYATFLVAKYLCEKFNLSLDELAKKFENCKYENIDLISKPIKERFADKIDRLKKEIMVEKNSKKISFSEDFRSFTEDKQLKLIEQIFKNGYDYSSKIYESDIYVTENLGTKRDLYFHSLPAKKKLSYKQFYDLIGYK